MAGEVVRIVSKDGRFGTVPKENLAKAEAMGWHVEAPHEANKRNEGTAIEAAGQGLVAGTIGASLAVPKAITAVGSAVLGTQDPLARFSGRQFLEDVGGLKEHFSGGEFGQGTQATRASILGNEQEHPVAFTGGELVGNVLGSGLLGAAGKFAGAGYAPGLARTVATGALEGGALGADLASEQAWVRNEQATAAQSLAGIGLGALFGGGGAAALHGAGVVGRGALARVLGRTEGEGAALAEAAGSDLERAAANSTREKISDRLANEAVEAVGARNLPALRGLARDAAERTRLGKVLNELGITGAREEGIGSGIIGKSPQEMLDKAQAVREKAGKALGDGLDLISQETGPVPAKEVFDSLDATFKDIIKPTLPKDTQAMLARVASQADPLRELAAEQGGTLTLRQLQEFRVGIDKQVKWQSRLPTGEDEALKEVRREFERQIEAKIDEFATRPGVDSDLVKAYRRAKDEYRVASWADNTLTERVERDLVNNKHSLNDRIAGAAGLAAGASHGLGLGLIGGVLAGAANKFGRQRGSNTIISLGRRFLGESIDAGMAPPAAAATARAVQTVVDDTADTMVSKVGKYLGEKGEETGIVKYREPRGPIDSPEKYVEHATEVLKVANNPEIAADRLQKMVGSGVASQAPGLYAAMAGMASRAANYLAANMPAPPINPNSVMPHLDDPPPVSKSDLMQYNARVEGVERPLSLLDDIQKNQISPEKVDAIKNVHPEILNMMRTVIFTHLSQRTKPLTYQQRMVLDLALDGQGTLEPSLKGDSLYIMQEAGKQMASDKIPSVKGSIPKISETMGTLTSKLMK